MNITLLGGSFNPPHNGHLAIANNLISQNYSDEVWFVPCAQHPFQKDFISGEHRVSMLKRIIDFKKNKSFSLYTYELDKTTTSYSIETLEHFQKKYPEHAFSWVVGSDQVDDFHKWHRYQDILDNFIVYVYPRFGYSTDKLYKGMVLIKNVTEINISSTEIKGLLQNDMSIDEYTSVGVAKYIENNNLYTKN